MRRLLAITPDSLGQLADNSASTVRIALFGLLRETPVLLSVLTVTPAIPVFTAAALVKVCAIACFIAGRNRLFATA